MKKTSRTSHTTRISGARAFSIVLLALLLLFSSCGGETTSLSVLTEETPSASEEQSLTDTVSTLSETESPTTPSLPSTETPTLPSSETPTAPTVEPYTPFYPEEKVIAFTFDDGPDWWTPMILDTIEGTDDKVTFFITGYMIDNAKNEGMDYAAFVKRAYDMGCDVGLHGYEHRNIYYESRDEEAPEDIYNHEIYDLAAKYKEITGAEPELFRPVGGSFLKTKNYGFPIILWSLNSMDWSVWEKYARDENGEIDYVNGLYSKDEEIKKKVTEKAVDEIVQTVLSQVKSGDIILMHDVYDVTRQAFAKLYPILKEQGYKLVTVSELLGIEPSEHTGQYFYSTYFYGENGNAVDLDAKK